MPCRQTVNVFCERLFFMQGSAYACRGSRKSTTESPNTLTVTPGLSDRQVIEKFKVSMLCHMRACSNVIDSPLLLMARQIAALLLKASKDIEKKSNEKSPLIFSAYLYKT